MAADRGRGPEPRHGARLVGLARAAIRYWALFGGLVIVTLVLMTAAGAVSNLLFGRPMPGDFEMVKHGTAIAAFAFLPYAQMTYANVTVDIFTERMGGRTKSAMGLFSSLISAAMAGLLFRQMWLGMNDYIEYPEYMVSVPIPLWTAFPPALVSLALLFVAASITAGEAWRGVRQGWARALSG